MAWNGKQASELIVTPSVLRLALYVGPSPELRLPDEVREFCAITRTCENGGPPSVDGIERPTIDSVAAFGRDLPGAKRYWDIVELETTLGKRPMRFALAFKGKELSADIAKLVPKDKNDLKKRRDQELANVPEPYVLFSALAQRGRIFISLLFDKRAHLLAVDPSLVVMPKEP